MTTPVRRRETSISMPPEIEHSNVQGRDWCVLPWNRDPSLTAVQRKLLKNMTIISTTGIFLSGAFMVAGSYSKDTLERITALNIGGSGTMMFFTMMCFVDPLRYIFCDLNRRLNPT